MESTIYTVPACNLPRLHEQIAVLNKRARKLGVPEIAVSSVLAFIECQWSILTAGCDRALIWVKQGAPAPQGAAGSKAEATGIVREWHAVTVTGQAPKFDGWKFIATLEPIQGESGETINLLQCVPGESCPVEFRCRIGECDHCKARRNRKQTFVVRHDNGSHKMVGRQCIRDFLGHHDPHQVAAWAELLIELGNLGQQAEGEDWGGGGTHQEPRFDLPFILAWTAGVIANYGWVSRTKARDDSTGKTIATADRVIYLLRRPFNPTREQLREWEQDRERCQPDARCEQDADAAREWARNFTDEQIDTNNYLANCNALARVGIVIGKSMGVACSILSSYQREQSRLLVKAQPPRSNDYVGTLDKRENFTLTVERVITIEGAYGTTGLHKMTDEHGNALVWFASGSAEWLREGDRYIVKATPKKHEPYQGRNQTTLNRVSIVKELGKALEAAPVLAHA